MSSRAAPTRSLRSTVAQLAAVAAVAAVLIWAALFVDLVDQRAAGPAAGGPLAAEAGPATAAPAPVTTRTS